MAIIVLTGGGLGNQMFQYAYGLALSRQHRVPLFLDTSRFADQVPRAGSTPRSYELGCFRGVFPLASEEQLRLVRSKWGWRLNRINHILLGCRLSPLGPVWIEGDWQGEKYFGPVRNEVRNAFQFCPLRTGDALDAAEAIRKAEVSVCVHIRRGDYVGNALHEVCDADYYRSGIDRLRDVGVRSASLFIFSDDVGWCRAVFGEQRDVYFISAMVNGPESLHLMTLCDHFVLSNSSFSWWGAWLGTTPEKQVVMPSRWVNDPVMDGLLMTDLVVSGWHVVGVAGKQESCV